MPHVLLIDDDRGLIPGQVRHAFPSPTYRVDVADNGERGLALVRSNPPDVILLDLRLPDVSGLALYESLRAIDARIPVIFVTVAKTADSAIEAMKQGAFDYLYKPLDIAQLRRVVGDALEASAQMRSPTLPPERVAVDEGVGSLFGGDPKMREIYKAIGRVAARDVPVLVTGESGTGKELVARAIYRHSSRSKEQFFALNCAAIPDGLLESELFGHEKGAFTGAERRRVGKFEQYNHGTILLDEIGDMPPALQAKLLRLLQDQSFERVGGTETIRTDVRLIASTHRDLKARCDEDKFRQDLYYRLSVFTIHLPPLRERRADIPLLVRSFVSRFSRELGRDVVDVSPEALRLLECYAWPGNVRELQSVIKQAILHATGPTLQPSMFGMLREPRSAAGAPEPASQPGAGDAAQPFDLDCFIREQLRPNATDVHDEVHRQVDRLLFVRALTYTKGNQREAARLLGISRQTMRVKLRALGLSVARSVLDERA